MALIWGLEVVLCVVSIYTWTIKGQGITTLPTTEPTLLDPCTPNPCLYGGICILSPGSGTLYTCTCSGCYTGENCHIFTNACNPNPCHNSGFCIQVAGSCTQYTCHCQQCYTGLICDTRVDQCADFPCLNGGTCIPIPGSCTVFTCQCDGCFIGLTCHSLPINPCQNHFCQNGGMCTLAENSCFGYTCTCTGCYTGQYCTDCISCGDPPSFPNAYHDTNANYTYPNTVYYQCNPGYRHSTPYTQCTAAGNWSEGIEPQCTDVVTTSTQSSTSNTPGTTSNDDVGTAQAIKEQCTGCISTVVLAVAVFLSVLFGVCMTIISQHLYHKLRRDTRPPENPEVNMKSGEDNYTTLNLDAIPKDVYQSLKKQPLYVNQPPLQRSQSAECEDYITPI